MDDDQGEFDFGEQDENLDRVTARIGLAIIEFYTERRAAGQDHFHADDLRRHITIAVGTVAPGSPDRVMRHLRQTRVINYRVTNRAKSEYKILPMGQNGTSEA